MANCRECKHWNGVPGEAITLEEWWPCAKGMSGLLRVDTVKNVLKGDVRLPWAIDNHDCPEFEEA